MSVSVDDVVTSVGRIKTLQDGRPRFIAFAQAKVIEVGPAGITVKPVGKNAILLCKPDDLRPIDDDEPDDDHAKAVAEIIERESQQDEPEGSIAVTGEVAEEKPKQTLKQLREKKQGTTADKPKPTPRRRRR